MKHPLHPLLVHFPIACWSLSTLGDMTGKFVATGMTQAIGLLLLIGCVSAVVAMAAGLYEISKLTNSETLSEKIDRHMYSAIAAWSFYLMSLCFRWADGLATEPNIWALITSVIGFLCLVVTGWYGANLVYGCGVGTEKLTKL